MKPNNWKLIFWLAVVSFVNLAHVKAEGTGNGDVILTSVRQLANGVKMMRDLMFLGVMGLPFLAMMGLGSLALAPYVRPLRQIGPRLQQVDETEGFSGRRTLAVQDYLGTLNNMEEVFTEYDIKEPECRLRTVCEVFQYSLKGEPMDRIAHFVRAGRYHLHSRSVSPLDMLLRYREAARSGRAKQDCSKIYGQCTKSLFSFIRNKNELTNSFAGSP